MKSIRDAALLSQILNLIETRAYDILCDIVDAILFNTGSVQSVLHNWGIKINVEAPAIAPDTVAVYCNGIIFNFTIKQYNEVVNHLCYGRVIEAIKATRTATNYGLKESKEFCEVLRDSLPR